MGTDLFPRIPRKTCDENSGKIDLSPFYLSPFSAPFSSSHQPPSFDQFQDLVGGGRDIGAGAVYGRYAGILKCLVVLWRNYAATHDHDIACALAFQRLDELGNQGFVPGGLGRDADDMHVVLHRLLGGFLGSLKKRPDVYIETDIGEGGGDYPGAPVVSILAELDHQKPGSTALLLGEAGRFFLDFRESFVPFIGRPIDAAARWRE